MIRDHQNATSARKDNWSVKITTGIVPIANMTNARRAMMSKGHKHHPQKKNGGWTIFTRNS